MVGTNLLGGQCAENEMCPISVRRRLPARRPGHTETLQADGQAFTATVGFDPKDGAPRELFLTAGKEGSLLNALLADAAVAISVALQHGVPAAALAKSVRRLPAGPVTPADLEGPRPGRVPLVSVFERKPSE